MNIMLSWSILVILAISCSATQNTDLNFVIGLTPPEINRLLLQPYIRNVKLYNLRPSTPNHLLSYLESLTAGVQAVHPVCGRFDNVESVMAQNARKRQPIECSMNETFSGLQRLETTKDVFRVLQVHNNHTKNSKVPGKCVAVYFYTKNCIASRVMLGEFYNAKMFFLNLEAVMIDSFQLHSLNTEFGIVGLPTLLIFHRGKPVRKFNLHIPGTAFTIIQFLSANTNLEPVYDPDFLRHDFTVLLLGIDSQSDPYLTLSWGFIGISALYYFIRTTVFTRLLALLKRTLMSFRNRNNSHAHVD